MASGWGTYARMVRNCNNQIWGAGLFGHDGTLWGQDGLPLKDAAAQQRTKSEVQKLAALCKEEPDNTEIFENGFSFLDRQWACVRLESNMIVGKGKAPNTSQFCGRKTQRCFVVAVAHPEGANTNAIAGAVQVGDYLDDNGY